MEDDRKGTCEIAANADAGMLLVQPPERVRGEEG